MLIVQRSTMYKTGVLVYVVVSMKFNIPDKQKKCLVMIDSIKMMCIEKFLHQKW
jgi:hypothetical protein